MKDVIFICEGITETSLLCKIFEKEDIELIKDYEKFDKYSEKIKEIGKSKKFTIKIANLNGIDKKKEFKNRFTKLKEKELENIEKVIFIVDADYTGKNGGFENREKAWNAFKESLEEELSDYNIDYKFYIMPDNENDGMSENLLMESLKCHEICEYINNVTIPHILKLPLCNIKNEAKSAFTMIAATQEPVKPKPSYFLDKFFDEMIDYNNEKIKKFRDFIINNI